VRCQRSRAGLPCLSRGLWQRSNDRGAERPSVLWCSTILGGTGQRDKAGHQLYQRVHVGAVCVEACIWNKEICSDAVDASSSGSDAAKVRRSDTAQVELQCFARRRQYKKRDWKGERRRQGNRVCDYVNGSRMPLEAVGNKPQARSHSRNTNLPGFGRSKQQNPRILGINLELVY
jgi:hypothetical protein